MSLPGITSLNFEIGTSVSEMVVHIYIIKGVILTLRLLMSYIYGAPSKARNAKVVYIWTYVW